MNVDSKAIAIDLFAGVGGLSLGLEMAGFHVAIDVEIEEMAGRYAQYNAPLSRVLYGEGLGDVRQFTADKAFKFIPRRAGVALVAGGPPCQGFSTVGRQVANDPLNDLVLEFSRVVNEIEPLAFLMENVPGLQSSGSPRLAETLRRLSVKYVVSKPMIMNAWDFGVPQTRKRLFILGFRRDLGIVPSWPSPTHMFAGKNRTLLPRTPTAWEAISDIPDVDEYEELISGDRVRYLVSPQSQYQEWCRSAASVGASYRREWDSQVCTGLRRTRHGDRLVKKFRALGFAETEPSSRIRRLGPDELATTIRAGTTRDRGSWSAPRPLHPFHHRVLTTRECARVQSFPDWFLFHPIKWHGNRMVGNAVPPLLAEALGRHILTQLGMKPSRSLENPVCRDESLVHADVTSASQSGFHNRNVSQQVVSWAKSASV